MGQLFVIVRFVMHRLLVVGGAGGLTLAFFLLLPLMQQMGEAPTRDVVLREMPAVQPPPPEPPEPEPPEPEEQEEPPQMDQPEPEPLSLDQLELSLDPGMGDAAAASMQIDLGDRTSAQSAGDALFSMSELDQRPQVTYQPSPQITDAVRQAAPGSVTVIFIVNQNGRVEQVKVQQSTHPALEKAVVDAVNKYRFQPGTRKGEPVRFRMQRRIRFPEL